MSWEYPKREPKVIHHKARQVDVVHRDEQGNKSLDDAGRRRLTTITLPAYDQVIP